MRNAKATESYYFNRLGDELVKKEEMKERMMKQIRHLLIENQQIKEELDEANRTIEIYITKDSLVSVDKMVYLNS